MDFAVILMYFSIIKEILNFIAVILIIICAVKYLRKH